MFLAVNWMSFVWVVSFTWSGLGHAVISLIWEVPKIRRPNIDLNW